MFASQYVTQEMLHVQEVCLEQPFTAQLQVHNASSSPVDSLALSLPAEEVPGFGMHLMVGPLSEDSGTHSQEGSWDFLPCGGRPSHHDVPRG